MSGISKQQSRRNFLRSSALLGGATLLGGLFPPDLLGMSKGFVADTPDKDVVLSGHVWVYSSKFPPNWDCTPILDQVFRDFKAAGLEGVELMESNLRNENIVALLKDLMGQYGIPVTGTSYYGDMWDKAQHQEILEDAEVVLERLHQVQGSTFGITVGDAGRKKTSDELDAQAEVLKKILGICNSKGIQANLHNHTFEVENDLYDFKGTIERVPEIKLGPDVNWLIRGGVDPVWFIDTYGDRMVYLHLRDQDATGAWTKVVGEGVTDFSAIAQALKRVNFSGRAAIELAFEEAPQGSVTEEWKKSSAYVKSIFGW